MVLKYMFYLFISLYVPYPISQDRIKGVCCPSAPVQEKLCHQPKSCFIFWLMWKPAEGKHFCGSNQSQVLIYKGYTVLLFWKN